MDISEFEEGKNYKRELDLDKEGGKEGGRIVCIFNLSRIDDNLAETACELTPEDFVSLRKTYVSLR